MPSMKPLLLRKHLVVKGATDREALADISRTAGSGVHAYRQLVNK